MTILPLRSDLDDYEFQVSLDDVTFDLRIRWNERDDTYYLSVYSPEQAEETDGSRTPILGGLPIRIGWPILRQFQMLERPAGDLIAIDTSKQGLDPARGELGQRVILVYASAEEVTAIQSEV